MLLTGQDVARKVTILARECGLQAEISDLEVESLVPVALSTLATGDEYLRNLPKVTDEQILETHSSLTALACLIIAHH
jgi:aspartokinase/homoserine dehydrogenase 1